MQVVWNRNSLVECFAIMFRSFLFLVWRHNGGVNKATSPPVQSDPQNNSFSLNVAVRSSDEHYHGLEESLWTLVWTLKQAGLSTALRKYECVHR